MSLLTLIAVLGAVLLIGLAVPAAGWLARSPRRDPITLLSVLLLGVVVRVFHRARYAGRGNIPARGSGALIVVANHTAGLDPLLIQHVCPFFIRWLMWRQMMLPVLGPLWRWLRILPLGGSRGEDLASMRDALRELASGGVVGIFPEGGIERPARTLKPFRTGVGLLIARSGARVLPVIIEDTHFSSTAWGSLMVPSRPRVTVHPVIDFGGRTAEEIVAELESRYAAWTGWPAARAGRKDA